MGKGGAVTLWSVYEMRVGSDGEGSHASGYCLSLQAGHISLVTHSSSALVVISHLAFTLEDRHLFSVCQHFLHWFTEEASLEYQFCVSFSALSPSSSALKEVRMSATTPLTAMYSNCSKSKEGFMFLWCSHDLLCRLMHPWGEGARYAWPCTPPNVCVLSEFFFLKQKSQCLKATQSVLFLRCCFFFVFFLRGQAMNLSVISLHADGMCFRLKHSLCRWLRHWKYLRIIHSQRRAKDWLLIE